MDKLGQHLRFFCKDVGRQEPARILNAGPNVGIPQKGFNITIPARWVCADSPRDTGKLRKVEEWSKSLVKGLYSPVGLEENRRESVLHGAISSVSCVCHRRQQL